MNNKTKIFKIATMLLIVILIIITIYNTIIINQQQEVIGYLMASTAENITITDELLTNMEYALATIEVQSALNDSFIEILELLSDTVF